MKEVNGVIYPDVGDCYKCGKCGKKILVERLLNGTDHTLGLYVCCWDCLSEVERKKAMERYGLKLGEL